MIVPAMTTFGASRPCSLSCRSPDCTVFMSSSVVIRLGHRYCVPGAEEAEQGERAERRADQRHRDVAEEPEVADPVDERGVTQVARQRQEHLADEERAEGGRQ